MTGKVLITGGGTGGHIYPALAIAEELRKEVPDLEIYFGGTREGLEAQIIPKAGYNLRFIRSAGIERRFTLQNLKNFSIATAGILDAVRLLNDLKPDVVVGTGGYVCGPILLVAGLKKIPILLQEQNAVLGVTNRLVQRFANTIALGDSAARTQIRGDQGRVVVTGNPVRPDFLQVTREEARKRLGFSENQKLVVVAGGSRGARSLNLASIKLHQWVDEHEDVFLYHGTGESQWQDFTSLFSGLGIPLETEKRKVVPYLEEMPLILKAADFIVSRAGAIALAEIAICGLPSLLVPYPYAAEDHQTANARSFVEQGAAIMIPDRELTGEQMVDAVAEAVMNDLKRIEMSRQALLLAKPNAAKEIAKWVIRLMEGVDSR